MKNKKTLLIKKFTPALYDLVFLSLAFFSSLSLSPLFQLAFSNPYQISNPFNGSEDFNPTNNYSTILFIIFSTLALGFLFKKLYFSKYRWVFKTIAILVIVCNFSFTSIFDSAPEYRTIQGYVDEFHAGEQLSPTHAFLGGASLYSEILFLRGAGVDVLFPAIGFSIIGESIGKFMLIGDAMMIISMVAFLILLSFLIRNSIVYWLAAIGFYISASVSILEFRDIIVWIFISLSFLLFKEGLSQRNRFITLFLIGLVSAAGMFVSIDRGITILASSVLLTLLLALFSVSSSNIYSFTPKNFAKNIRAIIALPLGIVLGVFIALIPLGLENFIAFIKLSFFEIPKFGGLLVSQPYPLLGESTMLFWGPVILAIIAGYTLYILYSTKESRKFNLLLPLSVLFFLGVIFLKIGSNRIEIAKLATATTPLFLLAVLLLVFCVTFAYQHKKNWYVFLLPILLLVVSIFTWGQLNVSKIITQPPNTIHDISKYEKVIRTPDNNWIDPRKLPVKDYIQKNTKPDDKIFSFTSNPFYYYLTDRSNATRFFITWFADPSPYSTELLQSLKSSPPSLVIYKDGSWLDAPDGISISDRIPEVNRWLLDNYKKHTVINNVVILEK